MSYTPGPWVVEPTYYKDEKDPDGYNIVSGSCVVVGTEGIYADGEADARLIASAPTLLETLKALLAVCDEELDPKRTPEMQEARAAIAKAEGK